MATMTTLSNPAGSAAAAASGYVQALFDILGDREPLAVLSELIPWLDGKLGGLDDARLRRPEEPGKWSVIEIVQHLADAEMVVGFRVRMALTQDTPPLPGYDQDEWVRTLRYRDVPLSEALGQLAAFRATNLRLYRSLEPAQWKRAGLHSERGLESVEHMVRMMAGHDLVHRRQVERVLGAGAR
jgi:DinB family protein